MLQTTSSVPGSLSSTGPIEKQRAPRSRSKKVFLTLHKLFLRFGLIVLPKHYYVPVRSIRELERTRDKWNRPSAMTAVHADIDDQLAWLQSVIAPHRAEYASNTHYRAAMQGQFGPGFGHVEAQALHGYLRSARPPRIIEIGSGVSTYCMLQAIEANRAEAGVGSALTCIEPFPSPFLRQAAVELVQAPVQQVDPGLFDSQRAGDFLFVDSTHTVAVGSDVVFIVLEVLPRLAPGVVVHFHDIYLPYHFPRTADRTFFHWLETPMVQAFLAKTESRVLCSLSMLHYAEPERLRATFPGYRPQRNDGGLQDASYELFQVHEDHFPSSTYIEIR